MYTGVMPKIWNETITAHRDAVREATIDATARLVHEHGLTAVTMSQIAKESGIGRATLYKYFPDLESILVAWHERHVDAHLHQLVEVSEHVHDPAGQLAAVLRAYATVSRESRQDGDLASLLHQGDHVVSAQARLHTFLTTLVSQAAERGEVRSDVPPAELAAYALHALTAATNATDDAALDRLVSVTLAGIRSPR